LTPARNHDGPSVWKSCRRRPKLTGYSAAELQDAWFWYVEWDRQPSNHEWEGHSAQASEAEWVYRFAHLQTQQYVKARHGESMYNHLYALNMEPAHRAEKPGSRVRRLYASRMCFHFCGARPALFPCALPGCCARRCPPSKPASHIFTI
jgi:hypothetical protein